MSQVFDSVCALLAGEEWRASEHALQRLAEYGIVASELVDNVRTGERSRIIQTTTPVLAFSFCRKMQKDQFMRFGA